MAISLKFLVLNKRNDFDFLEGIGVSFLLPHVEFISISSHFFTWPPFIMSQICNVMQLAISEGVSFLFIY